MFCDDAVGDIYSGYLKKSPPIHKMGQRIHYKTRFFCLRKAEGREFPILEYKRKKNSKHILGEIPLDKWSRVSYGYTLKVFRDRPTFCVGTTERDFYLFCKSEKEMLDWVESLCLSLKLNPAYFDLPLLSDCEGEGRQRSGALTAYSSTGNLSFLHNEQFNNLPPIARSKRKYSSAENISTTASSDLTNHSKDDICYACHLPIGNRIPLPYPITERYRSTSWCIDDNQTVFHNAPALKTSNNQIDTFPRVDSKISRDLKLSFISKPRNKHGDLATPDSVKSDSGSDLSDCE